MPRACSERMKRLISSRVRVSTTNPVVRDIGRPDELVDGSRAEPAFDLVVELLADAAPDVGAQLVEGVELGCRARQAVVKRRRAPSP